MLRTDKDVIELTDGTHIIYEDLLAKIATFLYVSTSYKTYSNNRQIYFDEIEETFMLGDGFIDYDMADQISNALVHYFGEQVADVYFVYKDGNDGEEVNRLFDITLWDNFVMGITEIDQSIVENRTAE